MAAPTTQDLETRFEELSTGAQLDILVPTSADFDPTTLFHDGLPGRLSSAPSRRNLYTDEITNINLILRTPLGERAVRSLLSSLEIVLAAHATDAVPQGQGNAASASGKHDLISQTFPATEISDVLFACEQTYIIWKPSLHVPRPRVRLQRPAVYFTASINLTTEALNGARAGGIDVLRSFEPMPANVLEPLKFDATFSGSGIYLPEDRLIKVLPASGSAKDAAKPIRGATKRSFPILPALLTRIRYSTLHDSVIASLHLETSQLVEGSVAVRSVALEVREADVKALTPGSDSYEQLAGDETVLLYKLTPKVGCSSTGGSSVSVSIEARVNIEQGSTVDMDIGWHTQVDLSKTLIKPTYKWSRPLSGGSLHPPSRPSTQPGSRPSSSEHDRKSFAGETGMLFNFTAQPTVSKGNEFGLDVQCINRSSRARRFALVVVQRKDRHASKLQQDSTIEHANFIATLFNAPPLPRATAAAVLDLNPDMRVGALPPGAIYEAQMKFRAVASGPLDLGVLRIVDLDTRRSIDVRELPDVIALKSLREDTTPIS